MTTTNDTTNPLDLVAEEAGPQAFDDELGRQMGTDAQRVWQGELSEQEFYEKYHDAVLEEFGVDDRPVGDNK
jgi:hypothetical protein